MASFPTEAPEGVFGISGFGTGTALSLTEIETLDLLAEGPVEGLNSGEYIFTGQAYNVGWSDATFYPFPNAPGLEINYLRSIYWNEVPVVNSLNKYNFQRIDTSFSEGKPNGSLIDQGSPELTISRTIGERLRGTELGDDNEPLNNDTDYSKYYRILNKQANGFILNVRVNQLSSTVTQGDQNEIGKIKDTTVEYNIYYRPIFSDLENQYVNSQLLNSLSDRNSFFYLAKTVEIRGKVTNGYIESTKIYFNKDYTNQRNFLGWEIKITRLTPDSFQTSIRNQTFIDSLTEIYGDIFVYPNSSIARSKFSAEFFQQIPNRAFDLKGKKVLIPKNYNPILKTYATEGEGTTNGAWNGEFTEQEFWTDNPAWCFYDLLSNRRYGLGEYIPNEFVDKWTLYEIAKYCDTLVPDGFGGLEPRFTCNLLINSREEAYKVINDFASIFRAITYYANGAIFTVQDSQKDPILTFSNANVEDGIFNYSTSSRKNRNSIAIVRYNDKRNFFKPALEYVEDIEGIRRYGIRETELTAFGCTSKGQAFRLGRWKLLSERLETETVNFTAGLEANYLRPGDIFWLYDSERKEKQHAGRIYNLVETPEGHSLELDRQIFLQPNENYELKVLTPSYHYNYQEIEDFTSDDSSQIRKSFIQTVMFSGGQISSGDNRCTINLDTFFDTDNYNVEGNHIWTISYPSGADNYANYNQFVSSGHDLYRVISIQEDSETSKFSVSALQYNPDKFIQIESGLGFEADPSTALIPEAPASLALSISNIDSKVQIVDYSFTVDNYTGITSYRVFGKKDYFDDEDVPANNYLIANLPVYTTSESYIPAETGIYYFRAYSANDQFNTLSTGYASGEILIDQMFPIKDIVIGGLNFENFEGENEPGIISTGEYFFDSPIFSWQAGITSDVSIATNFNYRVTIREPSDISTPNTPSSTIYYQDSGVNPPEGDLKFRFDFDTNLNEAGGVREYDVVVEAINNSEGTTSAGNEYNASNPPYYFDETWSNTNGYDIFYVRNRRVTGINIFTGDYSDTNYLNTGWIDSNGTPHILFTGGQNVPFDVVGGYFYGSTGRFTPENVTGNVPPNYPIYTGEFQYDFYRKVAKADLLFANIPLKTGWVGVSFYDSFDEAKEIRGFDIKTGLYVSNIVPLKPKGFVENITISNSASFINTDNGDVSNFQVKNVGNFEYTYYIDAYGNEIIVHSRQL